MELDGVPVRLAEAHDFRWLAGFGRVFTVFDEQDSGNIGFGVEGDRGRLFIKYAGAKTIEYPGEPSDAVARLREAVQPFVDLRHPDLANLVWAGEVGQGFVMAFDWFDGECMHAHWRFGPDQKYTNPASPNYRFTRLPLAERMRTFERILGFHAHVESMGYVAIDFYDGSILYDFTANDLRICDIDLYGPGPCVNTMGRMWGSSRFMSPEEFEMGAVIDGRTNVFNMGATAFHLLGGTLDRSRERWEADDTTYEVVRRAVSPDRALRQGSVAGLLEEWMGARGMV